MRSTFNLYMRLHRIFTCGTIEIFRHERFSTYFFFPSFSSALPSFPLCWCQKITTPKRKKYTLVVFMNRRNYYFFTYQSSVERISKLTYIRFDDVLYCISMVLELRCKKKKYSGCKCDLWWVGFPRKSKQNKQQNNTDKTSFPIVSRKCWPEPLLLWSRRIAIEAVKMFVDVALCV